MPVEIRRFGIGNRRPQGPPGSVGVMGQVIHSDASGVVAELAFSRGGRLEPHANPSTCWLVVIEGGGWVQVGEERARVAAGDAVSWPPDVVHGAWTDYGEMRAIVVELRPGSTAGPGVLEGHAARLLPAGDAAGGPSEAIGTTGTPRGEGALREDPERAAPTYDPTEGEPR